MTNSESIFYKEIFEGTFKLTHKAILNNNYTPYLVIKVAGINLPDVLCAHIKDSLLTLDLSPQACRTFSMKDNLIRLDLTFSGVPQLVEIPYQNVFCLLAKENSDLLYSPDHPRKRKPDIEVKPEREVTKATPAGRHLKLVK